MNFSTISKIFLIILLTTLAGCNKYQTQKRATSLEDTLSSYNIAIRWAEHETLYSYYVSPNGTQPPADLEKMLDVSVTGLHVKEKTINEEQTEANVKMDVKYFIKTQGSEKKLKLDLNWWYNEATKQWYIDGEFPKFK